MVPIMLAMLACGFGILANLHPKMEMSREPRGKIGKMIDQVSHQKMIYIKMATKMNDVINALINAVTSLFILHLDLP